MVLLVQLKWEKSHHATSLPTSTSRDMGSNGRCKGWKETGDMSDKQLAWGSEDMGGAIAQKQRYKEEKETRENMEREYNANRA